MKIVSESE